MGKKVIDIFSPAKKEKEIEIKKESAPDFKIVSRPASVSPLKKGLFLCLFFLVLAGFLCYFTLSKAEIEIWPETEIAACQTELTIDKEAKVVDISKKIIPGRIFQQEKSLTKDFQSSGKAPKEEKAEGLIRVYNNYSDSPQILIAATRFVSSDGKVFRTPVKVTIPAGVYEKGKLIPGEIDVKVVADEAGSEYNIGPANFSIPGFAGTDRYTKFYGKSFESMAGGFKEEVAKVTEEDLTQAEDSLIRQAKNECGQSLKNELQSTEISSKFHYFSEESPVFEIVEKISSVAAGGEAKEFRFQVKVNCRTLLFQKENLEDFAKQSIISEFFKNNKFSGEDPFSFNSVYQESLKMDFSSKTVDLAAGKIVLSLNVSAKIYSAVDDYNLRKALKGKSLSEAEIFLENQPRISRVNVEFWPFWVRKAPDDLNKIKIIIKID